MGIIPVVKLKQGVSWQLGIQPVSWGWIGLDTWGHRGDTPIRQVNEKYITKNEKFTNTPKSV